MMKMDVGRRGRLFRLAFVFLMVGAFLTCPNRASSQTTEFPEIRPVVQAMCGKSLALLGESPVHGFGKTLTFKVELVRALVDQCHYNALVFESGLYDFLHIQEQLRSGRALTDSTIAAAIGGLWANKEVEPLIPFLRDRGTSGRLILGGMDDQLERGTWAQSGMSSDLTAYLPADDRARCLAILQKYMLWQYTADAPYEPQDKAGILDCLNRIDARIHETQPSHAPWRNDDAAMIDSLRRRFERDFPGPLPAGADETTWGTNARDRSMYQNFRWLLSRLPPHSKVIVWTATSHAAKELSSVPGDKDRIPLGSFLRHDFGSRAFVLGFSAYSGSYAFVNQPVRELSPAAENSLEGRAFAGRQGDAVYLSRRELRKIGPIAARPLGTNFVTTRWDKVLDGLVIFRREQAPVYLRH